MSSTCYRSVQKFLNQFNQLTRITTVKLKLDDRLDLTPISMQKLASKINPNDLCAHEYLRPYSILDIILC